MDDMGGKQNEKRSAVPFIRQITQDGKPKLEVYRPTTNPIYINTQVSDILTKLVYRLLYQIGNSFPHETRL